MGMPASQTRRISVNSNGAAGHDSAKIRLRLLNRFELTIDGEPVTLPLTAERLVAFLALSAGPTLRSFVAGTLWIDTTEERSNGSLRSALWRLRQCGHDVVHTGTAHLQLAPSVDVDVHKAVTRSHELIEGQGSVRGYVDVEELALCSDILPDWYDDWVSVERERFRHLRLHALESLCVRFAEAGHYAQAVDAGLLAISAEPLRESAHRALIGAYVAEGNFAEALRQFETCRDLLQHEVGLLPSPKMRILIESITP